jgi:hypothetical protein
MGRARPAPQAVACAVLCRYSRYGGLRFDDSHMTRLQHPPLGRNVAVTPKEVIFGGVAGDSVSLRLEAECDRLRTAFRTAFVTSRSVPR